MARQGIDRRVVTAGRSKSLADPFLPQKPEDVERLQALQEPDPPAFIDHVQARRGTASRCRRRSLQRRYLGRQQAVVLGLAMASLIWCPKMKELYGDKVQARALWPQRRL